jgi:plastocyanin
MTATPATPDRHAPSMSWLVLLVAMVALAIAAAALTATLLSRAPGSGWFPMMGAAAYAPEGAGPGAAGFVAGTAAQPRVVHVWAGPGYAFSPSAITVARGETVTFEVTVMGPLVHEFMVGPADAVAGDVAGTPEIDGIGMMQSRSITYTFDGSGPYAFACHANSHYEAGMRGTIEVIG